MKKAVRILFSIMGIVLFIEGCYLLPECPCPALKDFDYRERDLMLYVKTINQQMETVGVSSAKFKLYYFDASRPSVSPPCDCSSFFIFLPDTLLIELAMTDTNFHIYSGRIPHYFGYQIEHGGDTVCLSSFDSLGDWRMRMHLSAELEMGDTLNTCGAGFFFPDTINEEGNIEVEMTFDMRGLFKIEHGWPDTNHKWISMNSSRVHLKQR